MNVKSPPIYAIIPFGRSGLVYIKWYQRPYCPLGITLFFPLDCYCFCITYSPQKAKKNTATYFLFYSLAVPCNFVSVSRGWVCVLGQVLVVGFRSFLVQFVFFPLFFIIIREHLQVLLCFLYIHQTLVHAIHCFHQILAAVINFACIVPVCSSNSESVRKTDLVFAYELRFWRSIYQNRSENFLDPSIPRLVGVGDFYFGQKVVTRSSFCGHKVFVDFEHVFWKFHGPRLSLV